MIEKFREDRPNVSLDNKFYSDSILKEWIALFESMTKN